MIHDAAPGHIEPTSQGSRHPGPATGLPQRSRLHQQMFSATRGPHPHGRAWGRCGPAPNRRGPGDPCPNCEPAFGANGTPRPFARAAPPSLPCDSGRVSGPAVRGGRVRRGFAGHHVVRVRRVRHGRALWRAAGPGHKDRVRRGQRRADRRRAGLHGALRPGRHPDRGPGHHPQLAGPGRTPSASSPGVPARRARPGRPRGGPVLGRVRAGRRRAARRPPGHHALGPGQHDGPDVPEGPGPAGALVHRRRRRADRRRWRRRDGPGPAPAAHPLRRGGGQPAGPVHGGAAVPLGRAGAVHRVPGPRPRRGRPGRRDAYLGARTARPGPAGAGAGPPGADEQAQLRPAVPGDHRYRAADLADPPAGAARPAATGIHPAAGGGVAHRCGFSSAAALRPHFRRFTGSAPAAYRSTFAEPPEPPSS
jgi:hypothetical protein